MKMRAIWQLIDAVIIPIVTYGAEGWDLTKTEKDKIQIIVNKAIKTVLFLPQGTPTTILLAETGYLPIEHVIKRKRIMQAHRVENMKGNPLIKRLTQNSTSLWKTETNKALDEYGITNTNMSKNSSKNQANKQIQAKVKEEISKEAQSKSKIKQWMDLKDDLTPGNRPKYMNELNRKQCNIIVKTRGIMLPLKANQKNQHQDLVCRFCKQKQEAQQHVLEECTGVNRNGENHIEYSEIFKDKDTKKLAIIADKIMNLMGKKEVLETSAEQTNNYRT